jgi:ankyrin repeat protein
MSELLAKGANPQAKTADGTTVLMAATSAKIDAVKVALESGGDVRDASSEGRTALHAAVQKDSDEVISLLVAKGANLQAKDKCGFTPLQIAEFRGLDKTEKLIRQLIAEQAKP